MASYLNKIKKEMASYTGKGNNKPYSPSAPPAPDPDQPRVAYPYRPSQPSPYPSSPYAPINHTQGGGGGGSFSTPPPQGYGYSPYQHQPQQQNVHNSFPPGTHPDVIRSFQMADRNQNGYIEEKELQEALAWNYQKFSRRTLRLLIFLFRNSRESSSRMGPKEFADIWSCLGQWRAENIIVYILTSYWKVSRIIDEEMRSVIKYQISQHAMFDRFDRDRSGKIDAAELRDALYSLGYALPPTVLQVLLSRYEDGSGRRVDLNFDSFVECGMIVKGLTEKFKEKDPSYTGSAKLSYDTFMSMIIPFIVTE